MGSFTFVEFERSNENEQVLTEYSTVHPMSRSAERNVNPHLEVKTNTPMTSTSLFNSASV